jgi:hypothetical protein
MPVQSDECSSHKPRRVLGHFNFAETGHFYFALTGPVAAQLKWQGYSPFRNVILHSAVAVRGECGNRRTCDFQGLWEEGEGGRFHCPAFHAFHQTGISTAVFFLQIVENRS